NLLAIAAQNMIVAGILAILVYGLTRIWRRPPVAHLLWLIVLAKFIGPPVLPVGLTGIFAHRAALESHDGGRNIARAGHVAGDMVVSTALADRRAHDAHPIGNVEVEPQVASSADHEARTRITWRSAFTTGVDLVYRHGNAALTTIVLIWIVGSGLCGAIAL